MKTNRVDNSINFNGIKLKTIKMPKKKIDIYSLDARDGNFIRRLVRLSENSAIPRSSLKIGDQTTEQITLDALKKAAKIQSWDYSPKVLISVENDKRITGIMKAEDRGDMNVTGMAVWNRARVTRKALLHTMLEETKKLKDFALIIPSKNLTKSMKAFCRKLGFVHSKEFPSGYLVDAVDMERVVKNLDSSPNYNSKTYKLHGHRFVDLEKTIIDANS